MMRNRRCIDNVMEDDTMRQIKFSVQPRVDVTIRVIELNEI